MSIPDDRLLQTTILLMRQFLLTDNLYARSTSLVDFELAIAEQRQGFKHVLDVYNFALALIDNMVRYLKVAHALPKLNQKGKEFRALSSAIGDFKKVRNTHQHLSNEVMSDISGPLLGSVTWARDEKNFIAALHDLNRNRSFPGLVYDRVERKFTQEFCYVYGETYYDLSAAMNAMRKFDVFIRSAVRVEIDGKVFRPEEHFCAICAEVRPAKLNVGASSGI